MLLNCYNHSPTFMHVFGRSQLIPSKWKYDTS